MVQCFGFWRKDTEKRWKSGWEFDFVLRFRVSLGIRRYCSCFFVNSCPTVYYNSQYLFLVPEWILTSNKNAFFQFADVIKKKSVPSTYELYCKLILPPNSLDPMMEITNKITQVDKLLQLWCNCQFSCSVVSDSLWPNEPQHARPPCWPPSPGVHSNPCPLSLWCHPTILSSVFPFSSPQSFPASGSFQMSQLFASGGQSIGVSASISILPWTPRTDLL